ncbi:MAG TPA: polyprenol monophosphomannose synthase [Blastocatellia bacterium]|nr:polyprenol monophosphomannose synthase [Blastocatellia bacterium]
MGGLSERTIAPRVDRVVIVLPTYNERENISKLLDAILDQEARLRAVSLSVLVVDDSSPDGTGEAVENYVRENANVHLLGGTRKRGLGTAYKRGIAYALDRLMADVVFEMDADFSHDPDDIPRLLAELRNESDFVIGSRYVPGGSIPDDWAFWRKLNSKWGNVFARYIAGLYDIKDCTSGYRAIRADKLKRIDMRKLAGSGYAFQMNLLNEAVKNGMRVSEIAIRFTDRAHAKSKLGLRDITEFILNAFLIRFSLLFSAPSTRRKRTRVNT